MPKPPKPFTSADALRRDRILLAADARGVTRKRLAEVAGLKGNAGEAQVSRWGKGKAHIEDARLEMMEAFLAGMPTADPGGGAPDAPEIIERTVAELREMAGPVDLDEKDELRVLARRHRRTAVGGVLKIALTDKSASVRLKAWEIILERSDGKAVQQLVDLTPKPPAQAEELVEAIQQALDAVEARPAAEPAPAEPTDASANC